MEQTQPSQLEQYIPVLMLLVVAIGFAVGDAGDFRPLLGKYGKRTKAKDTAYECGKDPIGEGGARFSVKFYLVAMLFILFDIEVVFLYPWAVVYRRHARRPRHAESDSRFDGFVSGDFVRRLPLRA